MSRHIVVGGASGFIGKSLVPYLLSQGHRVTSIGRSRPQQQQQQQQQQQCLTWDEVKNNGLPDDTHAICNLSGRSILELNPSIRVLASAHSRYISEVFSSRIDTTNCLLEAAKGNPNVKAFVTASAIGYYPPSETTIYDENYNGQPDAGLAGRLCSQIERNFLQSATPVAASAAASADANAAGVVAMRRIAARIGIVLGRDGGVLANMRPAFIAGVGGRLGSGKQPMPWIHIDDCVRLLEAAMLNISLGSGVMNVVAPADDTSGRLIECYASSIKRPALFPVPAAAVNFLYGSDRGYILLQGVRVKPAVAQSMNYQFMFSDIAEALNDLAAS